jgi:uncharacterized protein YjiS (DUF1127 family)
VVKTHEVTASMELTMSGNTKFDFTNLDYQSLSPQQREALVRGIIRQAQADRARAMRAALRKPAAWLWNVATMVAKALVRVGAAYVDQRRYGRQIAELQGLSDHELKDIGVRRSEIYWVVHHGRELPVARTLERPRRPIPADPASVSAPKLVKPRPVKETRPAAA